MADPIVEAEGGPERINCRRVVRVLLGGDLGLVDCRGGLRGALHDQLLNALGIA